MNARDVIAQFLDQWLQLTQRESQAIQQADWAELTKLQAAKAALQPPLRATLADWNNANRIEGRPDESEMFFRAAVDNLLALETRNIELLTARRQNALERKCLIEQAGRNLRLVRQSYARKPAMAWQVYS
jgi:hypothetical protein